MMVPFLFALLALEPFSMDWRGGSGGPADVSFLLQAPAGKDGFVTLKDGHLADGKGRRFRIWGINITAAATLPSRQDAPAVAAHLARFGLNCVRFHFLDRTAPNGLVDNSRNDTRALDPKQLDRLDFFIAELKKRGIYSNLNLNVGRTYKAGDGVRDYEIIGFGKALTYFDERLLELQREYARQLLTHRNPYTNAEYRHEPAVAIVELVNENSIIESWVANRLEGKLERRGAGAWSDIPAGYERALTEKYQAWLRAQGKPPLPRLARDEIAKAPAERFRTELAFYMEMEEGYFRAMRSFLKDELGVKALVVATSDHNHGISGYPLLHSAAKMDVVDGHVYWQHPRYLDDPATGKRTGFEIGNTPMVKDPLHSTVVELSRSAVAGKPYTVSEVNHPFPAEHACEGIPILAAYGAFQDWDGIFWYTLAHADPSQWESRMPGHFDFRPDPVKMTQLAAGALVFLRGDVAAARRTVERSYTLEQVQESLRLPARSERPYFTPGFPLSVPLQHGSRIGSFDRAQAGTFPPAAVGAIASDTGELAWNGEAGLVTVEAARAQSLVGFVGRKVLRNLAVALENRFCAVTLASLDGQPLARSSRMLLSAAASAANTGMQWNAKRTSLTDWGKAPTAVEPVSGTVTVRNLERAREVRVTALDGAGRPIGEGTAAKKTATGWEFKIGTPVTPWYAMEVKR